MRIKTSYKLTNANTSMKESWKLTPINVSGHKNKIKIPAIIVVLNDIDWRSNKTATKTKATMKKDLTAGTCIPEINK